MKNYFLCCIYVILAFKSNAQDSVVYTLQQCIDLALKNNLDMKISEYQSQIADAGLQQSRAAILPYANAYANQGINKGKSINPYTNTFVNQEIMTGQYGVNAGLTLFNGFNIMNTIRQSYFNYEASKMDKEQLKMDLTINVMLAYLQVLSSQEQVNQAASQVEVSKTQIERLNVLEANQAVAPSVLYDTKGQLANDKLTYITARSNLVTAKITLERLININFPVNATFEKIPVEPSLKLYETNAETIYGQASANLPQVRSAELRKLSALKTVQALRGQQFPVLSLVGSVGTNYSDAALAQKLISSTNISTDNYVIVGNNQLSVFAPQYQYSSTKITFRDQFKNNLNTYVGLSLQIPLFNGLKTRTQLNVAKINKNRMEAQQSTINVRLKSNINQAYNDMSVSFERYQVLEQQVKDYTESFKIGTIKFEKGVITTVDYIIAKNNIDRSKMNLIASKYEYILKSKILDYFMGKITL